jgi:hypothetical protein
MSPGTRYTRSLTLVTPLELDRHTMATYRGQAEKWIYPAIGATKLKDFKATDADRFFRESGLVMM